MSLIKSYKNNWHKINFLLAVLLLIFIAGMVTAAAKWAPYRVLEQSVLAFMDWTSEKNYKHYTGVRPEKFIRPARDKDIPHGVSINKPTSERGLTFITSMWNEQNGMQLIDMEGNVLHQWEVSYNNIWKDDPRRPAIVLSDWDIDIHGAHIYPNGDVVFNFEYNSLVKVDKCGEVIWRLEDATTHHSINLDEEGNLWVPGIVEHRYPVDMYKMLEAPIKDDLLLKISPEGKILESFSLLESIYRSGEHAYLFANGYTPLKRPAHDITHLNDIEVLPSSLADAFPDFNAGDLLVSARNINWVAVLDKDSKNIKWARVGPFLHQHDPDFTPQGTISVYDNQTEIFETDGELFGGSRIVELTPGQHEAKIRYKGDKQNAFYSLVRGKHQQLDNGNILITEHGAGKVFEVSPAGELVWMYVNKYNENEVYKVSGARRYPENYFTFLKNNNTSQSCLKHEKN